MRPRSIKWWFCRVGGEERRGGGSVGRGGEEEEDDGPTKNQVQPDSAPCSSIVIFTKKTQWIDR